MTVQTSSIGTVIDALLAMWRGLNLTDVNGAPISIFDGMPGSDIPDTFVQVGGVEPDVGQGGQSWVSLGTGTRIGPARDESYEIDCWVSSFVGGTDASGTVVAADAQKTARDQCLTVLAQLETAVRNDASLYTTLGGNGIGTGWIAFGDRVAFHQTDPADPEASKGRHFTVQFSIGVFKRLYSTA